jgi:hypothetical protein
VRGVRRRAPVRAGRLFRQEGLAPPPRHHVERHHAPAGQQHHLHLRALERQQPHVVARHPKPARRGGDSPRAILLCPILHVVVIGRGGVGQLVRGLRLPGSLLQYLRDGDRRGHLPATVPVQPERHDVAVGEYGAVELARGGADLPVGAVSGAHRQLDAPGDGVVPDRGADARPPPRHPAGRHPRRGDKPLGGRDRVGDPPRAGHGREQREAVDAGPWRGLEGADEREVAAEVVDTGVEEDDDRGARPGDPARRARDALPGPRRRVAHEVGVVGGGEAARDPVRRGQHGGGRPGREEREWRGRHRVGGVQGEEQEPRVGRGDEEPRGPARRCGVRDGEERGRERPRPGRVHEAEARGGGRREVHERVVPEHVGQRRPDGAHDRAHALPQPPPRRLPARPQLLAAVARRRRVRVGAGHDRWRRIAGRLELTLQPSAWKWPGVSLAARRFVSPRVVDADVGVGIPEVSRAFPGLVAAKVFHRACRRVRAGPALTRAGGVRSMPQSGEGLASLPLSWTGGSVLTVVPRHAPAAGRAEGATAAMVRGGRIHRIYRGARSFHPFVGSFGPVGGGWAGVLGLHLPGHLSSLYLHRS